MGYDEGVERHIIEPSERRALRDELADGPDEHERAHLRAIVESAPRLSDHARSLLESRTTSR